MAKASRGGTSSVTLQPADMKAAAVALLHKETADIVLVGFPSDWREPELCVFLVPLGGCQQIEIREAHGFQLCMVHLEPTARSIQYAERLRSSLLVSEGLHIEVGSHRKEDASMFRVGQTMMLQNLRSQTELNGQSCIVKEFDQETGRWLVQLKSADGDEILVPAENLQGGSKEEVGSWTLYLDEVPMPKRPQEISPEDCEVFCQDFPMTPGSQAESTWLGRFGGASDIFRLPGRPRAAYVQFQTHAAAAACVDAGAGIWSESERALEASQKIGSGPDYRKQLVAQLSEALPSAKQATGLWKLRMCGKGLPGSSNSESSRLHFLAEEQSVSATSSEDARMKLIHALQEPLMKLHENHQTQPVPKKVEEGKQLRVLYVSGLPESWVQQRAEEYFAAHGQMRCIRLSAVAKAGKRSCLVAYRRETSAKSAHARVNGAEVDGCLLKSILRADPEKKAADGASAPGAAPRKAAEAKRKREEEATSQVAKRKEAPAS